MTRTTALHAAHRESGARLVDFAGWEMPLHYGSQIDEHHSVRRDAGMFDVSHMVVVDLLGPEARVLLQKLLANNVARLDKPGRALYSVMLREDGGVIDDLIVYYHGPDKGYRLVLNAATREKDLAWMRHWATRFSVELVVREELAMLAVQGPGARAKAAGVLGEIGAAALNLEPFHSLGEGELFIGRTGYTGEDGWELMLPGSEARVLWDGLLQAGVTPCGLGARDTLRLEAGMNLYGADMDESTSPLESALGWTIAWEPRARDFIGRAALEQQRKTGVTRRLTGLVLEDRGVLRAQQKVYDEQGESGELTSGTYSPTLSRSIGLARVPLTTREQCEVEIRGRRLRARTVKPPFVRHGKSRIDD